jgi:hypothetical protein
MRKAVFAAVLAIAPLFSQTIPKTWDEAALSASLLPPPVKSAKIQQVPADYYYGMRERVMFRRYPVYASGSEPAGYLQQLAQAEPELTFDPAKLKTEQAWVDAGREVFRYPIAALPIQALPALRGILERAGVPAARDGTYPQLTLVVPKKGIVMLGFLSCATCHTRVQPDGSMIEGGQGTIPDLLLGFGGDVDSARRFASALFRVPWLEHDPTDRIRTMSLDEINAAKAAIPLGVVGRHGTSLFSPAQIPDLIGIKDRRYLDHTGLMRHRDIGDLMRYAALNNATGPAGMDLLADVAGFIPLGNISANSDNKRPAPETLERYSDPQLFALARFLYGLMPPPNPNPFSELARRGEAVFAREHCGHCHTPPLYTSNKLTPAKGFSVPEEAPRTYDIEPTVVGTDPTLAMQTRRGTGYYKVPSLRGVWYRGPFEHNGSVATLEDWFDPTRLRSDYVPTGFKGFGVEKRAVPGHPFGLSLSPEDKRSLIAFLKTL